MPDQSDQLTVGELRLAVQQVFFAFAALKPSIDVSHREEVRDLVRTFVHRLELGVMAEQGERLDGTEVDEVVREALDEVFAFTSDPPESVA